MLSGFKNMMQVSGHVNSYGQRENCYFCTVAALNNWTTHDLVGRAQTMMQDTAQVDEIRRLFHDAGNVDVTSREFTNPQDTERWVNANVAIGDAVGLAYRRVDNTGHMVVLQKMFGSLRCLDYQAEYTAMGAAPRFLPYPPEPNLVRYFVFYVFDVDQEIGALPDSFSKLRI